MAFFMERMAKNLAKINTSEGCSHRGDPFLQKLSRNNFSRWQLTLNRIKLSVLVEWWLKDLNLSDTFPYWKVTVICPESYFEWDLLLLQIATEGKSIAFSWLNTWIHWSKWNTYKNSVEKDEKWSTSGWWPHLQGGCDIPWQGRQYPSEWVVWEEWIWRTRVAYDGQDWLQES